MQQPQTVKRLRLWVSALVESPSRISCEVLLALACCVPLVAAWAEFRATGFLRTHAGFALVYWPGVDWQWTIHPPVWLSIGVMSACYLIGLIWLVRKRTLGRSFLLGICCLMLGVIVGSALNLATGWRDEQTLQNMHLAGLIDRAILAHWHNPLWEEVVFRGIPLLLLFAVAARKPGSTIWTGPRSRLVLALYFGIPALATALYHIPGHGPSRFVDSFIISVGFSWLALRFGFAAPLTLHYLLDAIIILSLHKVSGVPASEIAWLRENAPVINTAWSLLLLGWMASVGAVFLVQIWPGRVLLQRPRSVRSLDNRVVP